MGWIVQSRLYSNKQIYYVQYLLLLSSPSPCLFPNTFVFIFNMRKKKKKKTLFLRPKDVAPSV